MLRNSYKQAPMPYLLTRNYFLLVTNINGTENRGV